MFFGLLILFQFLWASTYVCMKYLLPETSWQTVLLFRYGIAAFAFLLFGQYRFPKNFLGKDWLLIALAGLFSFSGSPFLQFQALRLTHVADVSVMVAFEPFVVALLAVLILRERLNKTTLLAFAIATAGTLIMSGLGGPVGLLDWQRLLGDGLFLCAMIFEGGTSIAAKQLGENHPPLQLTAWMVLIGFAINLVVSTPFLLTDGMPKVSLHHFTLLAYLGLLCTALAYAGWIWMLKKVPVSQLALSLFLQPLFGVILAVGLLKETLDAKTLIGAGLILSALALFIFRPIIKNWATPLRVGNVEE